MSISAKLVMELRQRTGAGMMECKKFLSLPEVNGDIEIAILEMRKAGQAKADKKADRIAAEGIIVAMRSEDGRRGLLLELNSETDFAARDEDFIKFAHHVAAAALSHGISDVVQLSNTEIADTQHTVEELRQQLVAKIGENIKIRRVSLLESEGCVGYYLHGTRIGVLVSLSTADESLAKDIAMHIAASRPLVIHRNEVPAEALQNEREIFQAQAKESGKPQEIIEKMIEGRLSKFVDEVSLLGQPF
ncbi:MAG: translation elongation factor Ts, partial [Legionella sp. 21-45-4]